MGGAYSALGADSRLFSRPVPQGSVFIQGVVISLHSSVISLDPSLWSVFFYRRLGVCVQAAYEYCSKKIQYFEYDECELSMGT